MKNIKLLNLLFLIIILAVIFYVFAFKSEIVFKSISPLESMPQTGKIVTKSSLENMWGQPAKNMFAEINNPKYVNKEEAQKFIKNDSELYIFRNNNKLFVYPADIIGYHHIVNDTIDNQPVLLAVCLLSDSAIAFSRENKKVLSFGVLGPLYNGNLVMYDKESDSYWLQLTGEAFKGSFKGERLKQIAVLEKTTWDKIKNNQSLNVLAPVRELDFYRKFYEKYKASKIGLNSVKNKKIDERYEPFTKGLGITAVTISKFYPLDIIKKKKIISDSVGGWSVLITYDEQLGYYRIFRRLLDNKVYNFSLKNGYLEDIETKSKWNLYGEAFEGTMKGKILSVLDYSEVYWYSWSSFLPQTKAYNF